MLTICVKDPKVDRYYRAYVSRAFAVRHDNFALVSIGWTVNDDLPRRAWNAVKRDAVEISREEWNHSGCQSSCVRRGGSECRW